MDVRLKLKYIRLASIILFVGMAVFFYLPFSFSPSESTRIILDHDKETYIAPPCFNQAQATNYLEETTWGKARESSYESNSVCTKEALNSKKVTLFHYFMGESPFDW